MKKALAVTLLLSGTCAIAQENVNYASPGDKIEVNALGQTVVTKLPSSFRIVSDSKDAEPVSQEELDHYTEKEIKRQFKWEGYEHAVNAAQDNDGALQVEEGTRSNRAPIVNFNGLGSSGFPPDPSGAAGPDHYIQAVNTSYKVYNKDGTSATGQLPLSSLWAGSSNQGDPIVMYDRHADRWFISQFQSNPNQILIAVSETADPTGSYYAYTFNFSQFPDYPKYSIWWDGYYMTSNSGHTAVVFEREKMLAGDPTAQSIILSLPSLNTGGFRSPLSADADGQLPPDGTPCYFFNLEDNAFFGVSQDQIEIYEFTTNWTNTGATQVASSQQLPVSPFDAVFTGGFANIEQPGTTQRLDAIQGVLMYRAQHIRWTGYNTIVLTHAVDLGGNRSGVRWYELRDANDGNWTVHQQGTYAPGNTANRWMSSAAMDVMGNIGLAYAYNDPSSNVHAGIRYTGRLAGDPLGQMTLTEEEAVGGLGAQTFIDRYGDYSQTALDPDGITFWHTGEYLGSGGGVRTRIFSFRISDNVGLENPFYENLEMSVNVGTDYLMVEANGIHGNEDVQVDLIGMDGRVISTSLESPVGANVKKEFNTSTLGSGIYFVRVGNENFQKAQRVLIAK